MAKQKLWHRQLQSLLADSLHEESIAALIQVKTNTIKAWLADPTRKIHPRNERVINALHHQLIVRRSGLSNAQLSLLENPTTWIKRASRRPVQLANPEVAPAASPSPKPWHISYLVIGITTLTLLALWSFLK